MGLRGEQEAELLGRNAGPIVLDFYRDVGTGRIVGRADADRPAGHHLRSVVHVAQRVPNEHRRGPGDLFGVD